MKQLFLQVRIPLVIDRADSVANGLNNALGVDLLVLQGVDQAIFIEQAE